MSQKERNIVVFCPKCHYLDKIKLPIRIQPMCEELGRIEARHMVIEGCREPMHIQGEKVPQKGVSDSERE